MFIDFSRNLARKGGLSLLGNEDEPIFRGYALPDQPESSYFSIRDASFLSGHI